MNIWSPGVEDDVPTRPVVVSERTMRDAIDFVLTTYTRFDLEIVLADELRLPWPHPDTAPAQAGTKRALIWDYTAGWTLPQLVALAERIDAELDVDSERLRPLLTEYARTGGVGAPAKNLIFAANGPKPELVLADAVSNDIQITANAEYCLVFDRPIPPDGLTFAALIEWWRDRENLTDSSDRNVGLALCARLAESMPGNPAERLIFDTYLRRYRTLGFTIPAILPQVYVHYDPYTRTQRATRPGPLPRQRMDFLLLFSHRQRVVIEVDGRQHYADPDGAASPARYSDMVAEDRRLRLTGYEVYRFGGAELARSDAASTIAEFFDDLHTKMTRT